MKLKTLDRIQRAKNTWDALILTLEIVDFFTHGVVVRALQRAGDPKRTPTKRPADYTIKVTSERGTSRE